MKKKIGIFGGTFDPIHFGHLNCAITIREQCGLDEVVFIPCHQSPLRTREAYAAGAHRMEMVKRAIEGIAGFSVSDVEMNRKPPSYMIDTLHLLPDAEYFLILGEDALLNFQRWKEPEEIVKKVSILIASRDSDQKDINYLKMPLFLKERVRFIKTPLFDISSTQIRDRLSKKLYCGHLVPAKVLDYIYENLLYLVA